MVTWHAPVQTFGVFCRTGAKWHWKNAFCKVFLSAKQNSPTSRRTISVKLEYKTWIGEIMKTFGTEFRNFSENGSFSPKNLTMSPPNTGGEVMFSRCPSVRASLLVGYLVNRLGECHQIHNYGALGDKDELVSFLGQKVKDQGHDQTKCGQTAEAYVSTAHSRSILYFSVMFVFWCTISL